jgi:hypothetical protein
LRERVDDRLKVARFGDQGHGRSEAGCLRRAGLTA